MNLRLYIVCTAVVLALVVPAAADNSTATIHGAVYKWDTFEPLDNTVIYVNSTPTQEMVAKNGQYTLELVPGNYTIIAKYYQKDTLTYAIEKTLEIKDRENYVFDLLLPPVNSEGLIDGSRGNIFSENLNDSAKSSSQSAKNLIKEAAIDQMNNSNGMDTNNRSLESVTENQNKADVPIFTYLINTLLTPTTKQSRLYSSIVYYLLITLTSFLLITGSYLILRKYKQIEKNAFYEEKTGYKIRKLFELVNLPKLLEKVSAKVIDPEVRPEFKVNAEEAVSVTELESKIPNRKVPAESIDENLAQETELLESGLEKENKKTSNEEPALNPEIETPTLKKELLLPEDLQKVIDIIRSHGGLITQKDLCSRSKYSEVKVSLMLSNLEKRKRIKKFKRGRENLVILLDWKR